MKQSPLRIVLPVAAAVIIVVGSGFVHGTWTNRWNRGPYLENAVKRLKDSAPPAGNGLPLQVGEWRAREELQIDPKAVTIAGMEAYKARLYEHPTLKPVSMHLVCGRPGPISAHEPTICFTSSGYEMVGTPERVAVPKTDYAGASEFWTARFAPPKRVGGNHVRIFWSWSGDDGNWLAADYPRLAFSRAPVLYKLYVSRELTKPDEAVKGDACEQFLTEFLPQVKQYVLAPEGKKGGARE